MRKLISCAFAANSLNGAGMILMRSGKRQTGGERLRLKGACCDQVCGDAPFASSLDSSLVLPDTCIGPWPGPGQPGSKVNEPA